MKHFLGWLSWVGLYVLLPLFALIFAFAAIGKILVLLFLLGVFIIFARLIFPRYFRRFWNKCLP